MGIISFYYALFVLFVVTVLPLLAYWIPKKLGYPKVSKILGGLAGLLAFVYVISLIFEDELFFKSDAKKVLAEQGIILKDDVVLSGYHSPNFDDNYHFFYLQVSDADKYRAIALIKSSPNFRAIGQPETEKMGDRYFGPLQIFNYETDSTFVQIYYKPYGQENYSPTQHTVTINKKDNIFFFQGF